MRRPACKSILALRSRSPEVCRKPSPDDRAAILTGFVLSRTTGLPNATGDIGNWSEGLGLASMFVEAGVIALSGWALFAVPFPRRAERPRHVAASRAERLPA
jgi:hypothetical protein